MDFFPQSFEHNLNKACTVLVRVDLLPDVKCSIDGRCIFMKDNLVLFLGPAYIGWLKPPLRRRFKTSRLPATQIFIVAVPLVTL